MLDVQRVAKNFVILIFRSDFKQRCLKSKNQKNKGTFSIKYTPYYMLKVTLLFENSKIFTI